MNPLSELTQSPLPQAKAGTHFRICWQALVASTVSLAAFFLCTSFARTNALLVGLGLVLAFDGFVGVTLALTLNSHHKDD
jgi:hypothetical protein